MGLQEDFDKAAEAIKPVKLGSNDEMLELYGLFKQAKEGDNETRESLADLSSCRARAACMHAGEPTHEQNAISHPTTSDRSSSRAARHQGQGQVGRLGEEQGYGDWGRGVAARLWRQAALASSAARRSGGAAFFSTRSTTTKNTHKGMSKEDAMKAYIAFVEKALEKYAK